MQNWIPYQKESLPTANKLINVMQDGEVVAENVWRCGHGSSKTCTEIRCEIGGLLVFPDYWQYVAS